MNLDARTAIANLEKSPSDKLVCHYTKMCVATQILCSNKLRLSPFKLVNDPRENNERRFEPGDFVGERPPPDAKDHVDSVNRLFIEQTKLFCGTRDSYSDASRIIDRGFGRPRMWAQYGQNHEGVCLMFDREALLTELQQALGRHGSTIQCDVCYEPWAIAAGWGAFQLDYYDFKRLGQDAFWRAHVGQFQNALFFRKHNDWRAENEWRFVLLDGRSGTDYVFATFGDALKYVVGGCWAKPEHLLALTDLATVPILRLRFEPSKEDFSLTIP